MMLVTPKEKPVLENLNSYYVDIENLIDYHIKTMGCGSVYLSSPSVKGVVFFDDTEILNGYIKDKLGEISGEQAIGLLKSSAKTTDFSIGVYKIAANKINYWANLSGAEIIHKNLSTEFSDLAGLIKKMASENLTGFVEVIVGNDQDNGLIFFFNGKIKGGLYSWGSGDGELDTTKEALEVLIRKTHESGGHFHVRSVSLQKGKTQPAKPETAQQLQSIAVIEKFLVLFERVIAAQENIKTAFNVLLKNKLIEKAEQYAFLDPFAAEFVYEGQKVVFTGRVSDNELVRGVTDSVLELADELGIRATFKNELTAKSDSLVKEIASYGVQI